MRYRTGLALIFSCFVAGCGKSADPAPAAGESAAAPFATEAPDSASEAAAETPATPPPAKPSGTARVPSKLRALGTEPFWGIDIDGAKLVYTTPDDQNGQTITATRDDSAVSSTWTGRLGNKKFEVTIVPEKCSDGMSDTEYPFSARLSIGDAMLQGCAK